MHVTVIGGGEHGQTRVLERHSGVRLMADARSVPEQMRDTLAQTAQPAGKGLPAWLCHGGCVACCLLMLPVLIMMLFYAVVIIALAGPFALPFFAVPLWAWLSTRRSRVVMPPPAPRPHPLPLAD